MKDDLVMPILGDKARAVFTWRPRPEERERARINHGQTLERLIERGGLSWTELYCVLADKKLFSVAHTNENTVLAEAWIAARPFGQVSYRL